MKAKQLKRIVEFILQHTTNHTNRTIRALLKSNPEQFIDLLNDAIDQADVIPTSVVNFIKELSKQASPKQEPLTRENPTMKNQSEASKIMRLVKLIKVVWTKTVQFLTRNASKVKQVVSAVTTVTVSIMKSKVATLLTLIAAARSKGLVLSAFSFFNYAINLLKSIKDTLTDKLTVAMHFIRFGVLSVLDKLIRLKNFMVSKAKQAWDWVNELFTIDGDNDFQRQAA